MPFRAIVNNGLQDIDDEGQIPDGDEGQIHDGREEPWRSRFPADEQMDAELHSAPQRHHENNLVSELSGISDDASTQNNTNDTDEQHNADEQNNHNADSNSVTHPHENNILNGHLDGYGYSSNGDGDNSPETTPENSDFSDDDPIIVDPDDDMEVVRDLFSPF